MGMIGAEAEIQQIIDGVEQFEHGDPRLKELQRAMDIADKENLLEKQIYTRMLYIDEACFYDDGMKLMTVFPSYLKLVDLEQKTVGKNDDVFHALWRYKWILNGARHFYQVSNEQVERMAQDFKRRLLENGYSEQAVYKQLYSIYRFTDPEKAKQYYQAYKRLARDGMSDCRACEMNAEVHYFFTLGQRERAYQRAVPILEGAVTCGEMPYAVYESFVMDAIDQALNGKLLLPNEMEKLSEYAAGVRHAITRLELLQGSTGVLLQYYALFEPNKALGWFKKNYEFPVIWKNPSSVLEFAYGAMLFFGKLLGKKTYRMKMPANYPLYQESNSYNVQEVYDYYKSMAHDLMEKFEKGKQSDYFRKVYDAHVRWIGGDGQEEQADASGDGQSELTDGQQADGQGQSVSADGKQGTQGGGQQDGSVPAPDSQAGLASEGQSGAKKDQHPDSKAGKWKDDWGGKNHVEKY